MSETGWGEFELQFMIKFNEPSEKMITLNHQLTLYMRPGCFEVNQGGLKKVIAEKYEELVRIL